jgi:hypothetical protein
MQAFFARLLERRDFQAVREEKGRLRSFLLVSLKAAPRGGDKARRRPKTDFAGGIARE